MNLRQKLLLLFSLTVAAAVAAVAWTVLLRIREVFDRRDQQETALFISQMQREFQHRSADAAAAVERLSAGERVRTMGFELAHGADPALFLTEAQTLAQEEQLDFLEIVGPDGNIVSSAQWPARFGYAEPAALLPGGSFLKREELPDNSTALGFFAVRGVRGAESVRLAGGRRLDPALLADLPAMPGMLLGIYSDAASQPGPASLAVFDPGRLIGVSGPLPGAPRYQSLIDAARRSGQQMSGVVYPTSRREDSLSVTAFPLKNDAGQTLAVLTVSVPRAGMVAAQTQIRRIAYGVAAGSIFLTILWSLWIAARVSRPIEQLARAAEAVAGGSWEVRVPAKGRDEVAVLARSFNHMTAELSSQRERLIQSERVAAWRELARRLAHELKNPLFPLQLTVENMVRARQLPAEEFEEVFQESAQTLTTEIANLKTIIGRFSDFSKMPKPELERVDARELIERVRSLYEARAQEEKIQLQSDLPGVKLPLMADPELLHRALSNLVLNAMDAMPEGGKLLLSAQQKGNRILMRVADSGAGLTPEECARLFTPYYTTKQHGTGLGLAIVQSVVADHQGTIAVQSPAEGGAEFILSLPAAE